MCFSNAVFGYLKWAFISTIFYRKAKIIKLSKLDGFFGSEWHQWYEFICKIIQMHCIGKCKTVSNSNFRAPNKQTKMQVNLIIHIQNLLIYSDCSFNVYCCKMMHYTQQNVFCKSRQACD